MLTLFLAVQLLDGLLTYAGLSGNLAVERNQILAWWMSVLGIGPALVGAKVMAAGCGIALYLTSVHGALIVLTFLYVALAVVPWAAILWQVG